MMEEAVRAGELKQVVSKNILIRRTIDLPLSQFVDPSAHTSLRS